MLNWLACIGLLLAGESASAQERLNSLYEPQVFEGMPCRVMKPLGFDAKQSCPVIVSLHGAGGNAAGGDLLFTWNDESGHHVEFLQIGDVNHDTEVNGLDVDSFVDLLLASRFAPST